MICLHNISVNGTLVQCAKDEHTGAHLGTFRDGRIVRWGFSATQALVQRLTPTGVGSGSLVKLDRPCSLSTK